LTADLGTGLTTAITKDGQTTTTAKIPFAQGISAAVASNFAAGTVGAPSIYLSTDTTTGLYRIGANNDGFAISGVKLLDLGSALLGITGALTVSTTLGVTGASTIAALSATSGTFSTTLGVTGLITASANGRFLLANGATTGSLYADIQNTGGRLIIGVANSAGTSPISSSTAYSVILNSDNGTPIELAVSSVTQLKVISTGVTIPGTLGVTGDITGSGIIGVGGSTFRATGSTGIAYFGYIVNQTTLQVAFNSVSAGVSLSSAATSWGTFSDERMKDIFEPITGAAKKVASMRHAIGKYKTDEIGVRRAFFIAQDAQKVLPESVYADPDTGMLSLRYTDLLPLHGAAIAELEARLAALEAK
jgi:hypothetical protein